MTTKQPSLPKDTWVCPNCHSLNELYPYPTLCSRCGKSNYYLFKKEGEK